VAIGVSTCGEDFEPLSILPMQIPWLFEISKLSALLDAPPWIMKPRGGLGRLIKSNSIDEAWLSGLYGFSGDL
jgi:hypothetical protein